MPTNGATGVSPGGLDSSLVSVNATFNNTLDTTTITGSTFTLKDANNVAVSSSVSAIAKTATLVAGTLKPSSIYTATLTTGIKDINGKSLAANYSWSFTTGRRRQTAAHRPTPSWLRIA